MELAEVLVELAAEVLAEVAVVIAVEVLAEAAGGLGYCS